MKITKLWSLVTLSLSFRFTNAIQVFSEENSSKAIDFLVEDGKVTPNDIMGILREAGTLVDCTALKDLKRFCKNIPSGSRGTACGGKCKVVLCTGNCDSATKDATLRTKYCKPDDVAANNPTDYQNCVKLCAARCSEATAKLVCEDDICGTANGQPTTLAASDPDDFKTHKYCKRFGCCCQKAKSTK